MGKIHVVSAMTNSMQDIALHGPRRNPGFGGDRPLPATGQEECRDRESGTIGEFDQAPDSSRSRGYGRYEI
jgi:hypothetical protein